MKQIYLEKIDHEIRNQKEIQQIQIEILSNKKIIL